MKRFERLWRHAINLPTNLGFGSSKIHSSLVVTLGLIAFLFLALSFSNRASIEMRSAAITLPFVWCLSVAVRVAAQQVALGPYANDLDSVIGPTGNLSTDYEYLPINRTISYAVSGQLATLSLVAIGLMVTAATVPAPDVTAGIGHLFDFRGGWGNDAWATQIMWVNLFLAGLHSLPTVPFDTRAAVFAMFNRKNANPQEPSVLHRLAQLDSHIAAIFLGAGCALAIVAWSTGRESVGWYGAIAASIYLFVASRWEASRAHELEQQYAPIPVRIARSDPAHPHSPTQRHHRTTGREAERMPQAEVDARLLDPVQEAVSQVVDIDEILRKLHREGSQALSSSEHEALLSASRQLKEKRGTAR